LLAQLPRRRADVQTEGAIGVEGGVERQTILVAEDSRVVRAILREPLSAHGYRVLEAADGEQALACCLRDRPDMVLLDVEMPVLDGHQVLARIKQRPELADVPVVFLTARATTEDVVQGLRLGAHDYLRKPFEASELLARVSAALRVKALQDELRRRNLELDRMSRTDALTGLYNRRHLEERLGELVSLARRHGEDLGAALVDLDHFKAVNDTAGHPAGDAVLQVTADRLRNSLRAEDVLGRWGGEEFLVLLPRTDAAGARLVAERMRQALAGQPIPLPDGGEVKVTASIGVAAGTDDGVAGLVDRADAALYEAKAAGRDRVVVAPALRVRV
jgi:two-component system, cell cycle response regulator